MKTKPWYEKNLKKLRQASRCPICGGRIAAAIDIYTVTYYCRCLKCGRRSTGMQPNNKTAVPMDNIYMNAAIANWNDTVTVYKANAGRTASEDSSLQKDRTMNKMCRRKHRKSACGQS